MRVFLAIAFPLHIQEDIIQEVTSVKQKFPDFKWVKKTSLHLTLKFLGNTEPTKIAEINSHLKNSFEDILPFELICSKSGLFPNSQRPRVFYLGLQESSALSSCYEIIENKLTPLGFKKETRKFNPHITLARIKNTLLHEKRTLLLAHSIPKIKIYTTEITLMQSNLFPDGARYTAVQRFSLRSI